MKLESDGSMSLPTCVGSICSFLLLFFLIAYSVQKFDIMINRREHDIIYSMMDSYYDGNYVFDYEQGFNIAVAFSAYDSE